MVASAPSTLHRSVVEHMVRQAVYQRLGRPLPRPAAAPNPLVVNVSARHCHLTPEAVETLNGKEKTLSNQRLLLHVVWSTNCNIAERLGRRIMPILAGRLKVANPRLFTEKLSCEHPRGLSERQKSQERRI